MPNSHVLSKWRRHTSLCVDRMRVDFHVEIYTRQISRSERRARGNSIYAGLNIDSKSLPSSLYKFNLVFFQTRTHESSSHHTRIQPYPSSYFVDHLCNAVLCQFHASFECTYIEVRYTHHQTLSRAHRIISDRYLHNFDRLIIHFRNISLPLCHIAWEIKLLPPSELGQVNVLVLFFLNNFYDFMMIEIRK